MSELHFHPPAKYYRTVTFASRRRRGPAVFVSHVLQHHVVVWVPRLRVLPSADRYRAHTHHREARQQLPRPAARGCCPAASVGNPAGSPHQRAKPRVRGALTGSRARSAAVCAVDRVRAGGDRPASRRLSCRRRTTTAVTSGITGRGVSASIVGPEPDRCRSRGHRRAARSAPGAPRPGAGRERGADVCHRQYGILPVPGAGAGVSAIAEPPVVHIRNRGEETACGRSVTRTCRPAANACGLTARARARSRAQSG